MMVELRNRLREIDDLGAAGGVLNWDQATYMPEGGAERTFANPSMSWALKVAVPLSKASRALIAIGSSCGLRRMRERSRREPIVR
jgi:Zn-dependent M32 family carboxypeptidase